MLSSAENVKYLGMFFGSKMNWKKDFEYYLNKVKKVFWTCRSAIGRAWGLSPEFIHWIYRIIICLVITYSSVVRLTRVGLDSAEWELTKL